MEEIKNNEEYTSNLKGQSSHRDIVCWGDRDIVCWGGRDRDSRHSGPVIKTQRVGYAPTHRRECFLSSVLHNRPGNFLKDNNLDNIG